MPKTTLTDARVRALKPRKTVRDVRDGKLAGFGVRMLSSGRKQFFIHCQHRGERIWKTVADAATMSVAQLQQHRLKVFLLIPESHPAIRRR